MKIYPLVLLRTIERQDKRIIQGRQGWSCAYRFYFLAKYYDDQENGRVAIQQYKHDETKTIKGKGSGAIPQAAFEAWLLGQGLKRRSYEQWRKKAIEIGLMEWDGDYLRLEKWGAAFAKLELQPLEITRAVYIPLKKLIRKRWAGYVWGAYLKRFDEKPIVKKVNKVIDGRVKKVQIDAVLPRQIISRQRLEQLTGIATRTQIKLEKDAGIKHETHFSIDTKKEQKSYPTDKELGIHGFLYQGKHPAHRRPNGYMPGNEIQNANKGQLKKIRQGLKNCLFMDAEFIKFFRINHETLKALEKTRKRLREASIGGLKTPDVLYYRTSQRTWQPIYA